jgi:hypothetical protein
MKTTREVTTATKEVMRATTARGAEVMKREDIKIQVITIAIMGRKVNSLLAITTMTIRATKGRKDTTVTTVANPKVVTMVVPLTVPATVTVVETAGAAAAMEAVVTEVAEALEAVVTEVVAAMEAVVTEVVDMVGDTEEMAAAAVVTAAAVVVVNITKVEPGTCCYVNLPCLKF